jgi:hypothetical protein
MEDIGDLLTVAEAARFRKPLATMRYWRHVFDPRSFSYAGHVPRRRRRGLAAEYRGSRHHRPDWDEPRL